METTEMRKARGVVAAVSQKPNNYGFKIGDVWYGGFGECPLRKGDYVEVDYVENGRFKDVQDLHIVESQGTESGGDDIGEIRIARAVALKCAVQLCGSDRDSTEDVIAVASKFEEWLRATSSASISEARDATSTGGDLNEMRLLQETAKGGDLEVVRKVHSRWNATTNRHR